MFNPSTDLVDIVEGLEPVTLHRRGGPQTSIARALRRAVTTREPDASDGQVTLSDVHWHLPAAECPDRPSLGDALMDSAGDRWTVLAVAVSVLAGRWDCACRNLAVVHRLDDVVAVQRAEYEKGEGGAAVERWHTWRTGLRARIQPLATQPATTHGTRRTVDRFQIFLAEDLAIDHRCRILAADGTLYRVTGSRAAERIDQLQVIEAEGIR